MRRIIFLLLFLTCCTNQTHIRTLQINYVEDSEIKTVYLNVKESSPYYFEVLSQEHITEKPNFLITNIFDYNIIK